MSTIFNHLLSNQTPYTIILALVLLHFILKVIDTRVIKKNRHIASLIRAFRNLVLPTSITLVVVLKILNYPDTSTPVRLVNTLLWVFVFHIILSLLNVILFVGEHKGSWRDQVPKIFVNLSRLVLILIGLAFILSVVWGQDLKALFAALGVGSIVVGFALQDTLGSLFAGIALLSEKAYKVGDWIEIGETKGRIVDVNWRSVSLQTREHDLVRIPNSVMGNQIIKNLNRPTTVHTEIVNIGFSYNDPPNQVKELLKQAALTTKGVLPNPVPEVQTMGYNDSAIDYRVLLHLSDLNHLLKIRDDFLSQVWYLAKRNKLTIPFPIRTIHRETQVHRKAPHTSPSLVNLLRAVSIFSPLEEADLVTLADNALTEHYGKTERIVRQGDPGNAFYVIINGEAVVEVCDDHGKMQTVGRIKKGDFFGEMSLLTGEPRSAFVTAQQDMDVLVIYPGALKPLLESKTEIALQMAEIIETRKKGLKEVREKAHLSPAEVSEINGRVNKLFNRIKHFVGV
ncbi:MAG: mechanosensitive ion channel family protein [Deltaproteobacteria bacterium]|nr:mechanosensitive ion channel family protein [Deltaproteobacteria bacterium]